MKGEEKMRRAVFATILTAASIAVATPPAAALDKEKFVQHLRETLNLDTRTTIEAQGEAKPSGVGDLNKITVLVGGAPYDVLITKDEKLYIWGFTADMAVSPDKQRAGAIKLDEGHSVGASTAAVTIVEYSDFACSFCKN